MRTPALPPSESIDYQEMARDAMKERRWDKVWEILREVATYAASFHRYRRLVYFCITTDCPQFGEWFARHPQEAPPSNCLGCHKQPFAPYGES